MCGEQPVIFIIHSQIIEALTLRTRKIDARYLSQRLRFHAAHEHNNCDERAPDYPFHCATLPCNRRPAAPAAKIMIGSGIFFVSISAARVTIPMITVGMSTSDRRARMYAAPAIAPTAAAVTPCTKAF